MPDNAVVPIKALEPASSVTVETSPYNSVVIMDADRQLEHNQELHYSSTMRRLLDATSNSSNSTNVATTPSNADTFKKVDALVTFTIWLRGHPAVDGWSWNNDCKCNYFSGKCWCDGNKLENAFKTRFINYANTLFSSGNKMDPVTAAALMFVDFTFSVVDFTFSEGEFCDPDDYEDVLLCMTEVKVQMGVNRQQAVDLSAAINTAVSVSVDGVQGVSGLFKYSLNPSQYAASTMFPQCSWDTEWINGTHDAFCILARKKVFEEVCRVSSGTGVGGPPVPGGPGPTGPTCDLELKEYKYTIANKGPGYFTSYTCGDSIVSKERGEICDDGGDNVVFGPCSDKCQCATGLFWDNALGKCTCTQEPDIEFMVHESSKVQDDDNILTFRFLKLEYKDGISPKVGNSYDLTELPKKQIWVTVSGLTGSATPSDSTLDIGCVGPATWGNACLLGIPPTSGSQWMTGKAKWDQSAGTLEFVIIASLDSSNSTEENDVEHLLSHYGADARSTERKTVKWTLKLYVTLKNGASARNAVSVSVSTCLGKPVEQTTVTPRIFGFNAIYTDASELSSSASNAPLTKSISKTTNGVSEVVVTLTMPSGMMATGCGVYTELLEDTRGDLTEFMARRTRVSSKYIGTQDSLVLVWYVCSTATALAKDLTVKVSVDRLSLKSAGGCYTTETNTATICVPAYVGVYAFNYFTNEWTRSLGSAVDATSVSASEVAYTTRQASNIFGAISSPQCCDYKGLASSCGDKVCMKTTGGLSTESPGTLGDGTLSKMPTLTNSARPAVTNMASLATYLAEGTSGSLSYKMRSGWTPLCIVDSKNACTTSQTEWFAPRFLHSTVAVSTTRVLIYGGIGCARTDSVTGFCTEVGGALADL